jgi:hypothetical protein
MSITVAALYKVINVFTRSVTVILGSNPTRGIYVCDFSVCVGCDGNGLMTGLSPVQGVLPSVYMIHSFKLILNRNISGGIIRQRKKLI